MLRLCLAVLVTLWVASLTSRAQTTSAAGPTPLEVKVPSRKEPVSYANEVSEFLEEKCVGCHGSALAENRLNLETVERMLKGGKRGPALVAGKARESLLFKMAAHQVEPTMPPKDKPANKPLSADELGLLKRWIDEGAKDDATESSAHSRTGTKEPIELGDLPPGVQPINAVDLSADGARVAAGRANSVQVYDVDSGLEIISLGGHKDLIQSVRFSADAALLAAGSYRIVTLWRAPTGRLVRTLSGHNGPVLAVAVAEDGTIYSGGQDRTIRVWSTPQGKQSRYLTQPAPVTALVYLPAAKAILVGGSDGQIRWLDAADGRERFALKGYTAGVQDLAVLASDSGGTRVVSISEDGTGRIWALTGPPAFRPNQAPPAAKGKEIILAGHKGPVRAVATAPNGEIIVTAGDDSSIRLWSARDGSSLKIMNAIHAGPILALAVAPDGKTILTGSSDKSARLIALSDGRVIRTLTGHRGPVRSVAFSPQGDRLATADAEGGLKVWEAASGLGVIAFGHIAPGGAATQSVQKVAFTTAGSLVSASADSTLKTWSFTGAWTEHKLLDSHVSRVLAIDFSPDGKLLATAGGEPSRSGEIKLWEAGKGLLARALDSLHSDAVFGVRFSSDGTMLASASADKFLKVTNIANGKLLRSFEGHTHHVMAVDWRSDGKQLVSGGADNVLKVWDFESGDQIRTLQAAGKQVTSVRWIAGKPDVVGASGDSQVRIWNADNDGITRTFAGPTDYAYSVAASSDGARIAAGGADSRLFVWNGGTGQVIRKLEPPAAARGASPRAALAK
jgi:WD40 repeat protein